MKPSSRAGSGFSRWVPESPGDILVKSADKYMFLNLLNQDTRGTVLRKSFVFTNTSQRIEGPGGDIWGEMPTRGEGKSLSQGIHPLPTGGLRNPGLGPANMAPAATPSPGPRLHPPSWEGHQSRGGFRGHRLIEVPPDHVLSALTSTADKYCPLLIKEGGMPLLRDMIKMATAAGDQGNGPVRDWQCFCLEPGSGFVSHSRPSSWVEWLTMPGQLRAESGGGQHTDVQLGLPEAVMASAWPETR